MAQRIADYAGCIGRYRQHHLRASSCNGHWDLQSSMGVAVSNAVLEAEKSEIKAKSQDLETLAVLCSVLRMCGLEG